MLKRNLYIGMVLFLCCFCNSILSQTIQFSDVVIPGYSSKVQTNNSLKKTATTITINEVAIIAVDYGATATLPSWYNDLVNTKVPQFFAAATFNNYNYNVAVLKLNATNAFTMPNPYTPPFDGTCQHVHSEANILAVLQSADAIYNFNNYDYDGDGIVEIHFCSIGPSSGGLVGSCITYNSNDYTSSGTRIVVYVNKQTRGVGSSVFESVYYHETGHDLFNFPDMDHSGADDYNHYGLGGFEVMSGGGFQDQPSPYTPVLRHIRNWFTPTAITSSASGLELKDFQMNSTCYVYEPTSLPAGTLPNQKYYISYHSFEATSNPLYRRYPYLEPTKGGILIWHSNTNSLNLWTDFSDWRNLPIDIECAHGKTNWTETSTNVTNSGVENPLTGRDKLEVRKIAPNAQGYDREIAGPYYGIDKGDGTIFYTPDNGKNFTLFTNPNSNWYNSSESYSQNKSSGFSIKNIRTSSGQVYADFILNDFTVTSNTTLRTGTWYIYNNITVNSGVSLTIEPGTTLLFDSGKSLTVNGVLTANGSSSQPITFTSTSETSPGSWGSIVLNGSGASGSTLSYIKMQYGTNIQATNTSNVSITHSKFLNNENAVSFTGSTGTVSNCYMASNSRAGVIAQTSSTVTCNYDTIKTSVTGLAYIGGSYGDIGQNDIDYNSYSGISVGSSSAPMFKNVPSAYARNNRITNCGWGIYISSSNSLPIMYNGSNCNGYNTIYDNTTYDINNLCSSILDAVGVYWKNGNPNNALTNGNVVKSPYCSTDPWAGIPLPKQSATVSSVNDPLLAGIQLRGDNRLKEAKDFYITYLSKNPEDQRANVELYSCYNEETASDITKYFESITDKAKQQNILLGYLYVKQGKINAAKEVNNNVISKTQNNAVATTAKVNNFYIALYYEGDLTAAASILQEIRTGKDTQNADEISLAEYALKTYVPVTNVIKGSSLKGTYDQALKVIASALSIDQNYPNPFNPTTNISFSIPQRSNVKLVVYDVLGKEVTTLANSVYEAGKYEVQFNGNSLASGMYFYTLTTAQGTISKKMLLVK